MTNAPENSEALANESLEANTSELVDRPPSRQEQAPTSTGQVLRTAKPRMYPYDGDPVTFLRGLRFWVRAWCGLQASRDVEACLDDVLKLERLLELELAKAEAVLVDHHLDINS